MRAEDPPLDLEKAIQLALSKNYAIHIEAINLPIAEARVTEEYGRFDPSFQLRYQAAETGTPRPGQSPLIEASDAYDASFGGLTPWGLEYNFSGSTEDLRGTENGFAHNYGSFAGVNLRQPLLKNLGFGSGLTTIRIAKTNRKLSEWDYRQTLIDTITNVIFAYHNLYLATQNLRAAIRSRDSAANLLAENERRFQAGDVSTADVTSARARVAFREDSILRVERSVRFQSSVLRQLISDDRDPTVLNAPLVIAPPPPAPTYQVNAADDFRAALINRPDYQRSRLELQRSRLTRNFESNQRLPQLDLVGSYGYSGLGSTWPESRRNVQDRDVHSYTAGAVVTVPLTFAQQRGRYRAADLQLKQAETRVEQVEQQAMLDVGNAAADVETAQRRIATARRARELAQQSLDDELKLHRVGKSTTLFVLQAQEFLSQAELNEFDAISDAHKTIAEYDRQLGRTLEKHHVEIVEEKPRPAPRS